MNDSIPVPPPASSPRTRQLAVLFVASSLTVLASAVIAPALPSIRAAFADVPEIDLLSRLLLTTPALGVALFGRSAGALIDRLGARRTLIASLVLYGLAGTTGLWIDELAVLLVARLVLGISVAGLMTAATVLITGLAGDAERERVLGIQAAAMGLGGLVFLTGGGALATISWRGPFAVYALAWLIVPAAALVLQAPATRRGGPSTAVVENAPPGESLWPLFGFAAAGMTLFFLVPIQAPFLFGQRFGASSLAVGAALGSMTLANSSASLAFGRVRLRMQPPKILATTFSAFAIGMLTLALAPAWPVAIAGLLVMGLGGGLLFPNISSWTTRITAPSRRGRALGLVTGGFFVGQFVSPLVVTPLAKLGVEMATVFELGAVAAAAVALVAMRMAPGSVGRR